MTATAAQILIGEISCYFCYGPASIPEMLEIALWNRLAGG